MTTVLNQKNANKCALKHFTEEAMPSLDSDLHKSNLKTKKKNSANKKFQRFFGSKLIGNSHEQVISIFSCALLRNHSHFLLQGHLYVTKRFYGFHSNIFGYRTALLGKWSEVTSLKKENIALFFPTAISFTTKNNEKFTFASFLSRNYAIKYFCKLWHLQSPFYDVDLSENGEVSSFDSKEMIAHQHTFSNHDKTIEPMITSSERYQINNEDDTSSDGRSNSTESQSVSYESKSKSSISSDNKNDEISNSSERNSIERPIVNSSIKDQNSIPNNEHSIENNNDSMIVVNTLKIEDTKKPTNFLNKMFVFLFSKHFLVNFLVILILFVILITLYIYGSVMLNL